MATKFTKINNAFYDELQDKWIKDSCHPVALLRAENAIRNPWISSTIQSHFSRRCKILDIGCGAGLLSNPLAHEGHEVTGIDLSLPSLEVARQNAPSSRATYLQLDAEQLPFEEESFDVVCAMDLLEHVHFPNKVIAHASRVLKKNGLFFFHTFNRTWLSYFLVIKGVELFVKNTPKNMHVYSLFIKPDELKNLCEENQLNVKEIQGLVPYFTTSHLCHMLVKRTVPHDFRFTFSPSLKTGYLGYAQKVD